VNEKIRAVIIGSERWQSATENSTPMVKLTVLDIDTLENDTFHMSETNAGLLGVGGVDKQKVVAIEIEFVKQLSGSTYKRRAVKFDYTGEVLQLSVKAAK